MTKQLQFELVEYLSTNKPAFLARMEALSDRDYVGAWLKLMEMVMPKKQEIEVEATQPITWNINPVRAREILADADFEDVSNTTTNENESNNG